MPSTPNDKSTRDRKFNDLRDRANHMLPVWRDLAWHILPTRPRFLISDATNRTRWGGEILDGTATRALTVAVSGLMGQMANPASRWFEYDLVRRGLGKDKSVRSWLDRVGEIALHVFDNSNTYEFLASVMQSELTFATGGGIVLEHEDNVLHSELFPIGSYHIGRDVWGSPNQVAREYTMSAAQLVEKYGIDTVSSATRNAFLNPGQRQRPVEVRHLIEPNPDFVAVGIPGMEGKRFRETFWEHAGAGDAFPPDTDGPTGGADGDKLAEGGYETFPCVIASWERNPEQVWSTRCPGIDALPDIKQLQAEKRTFTNAMNKQVKPPTVSSASSENNPLSHMPGARNIDPGMDGPGTGTREMYQVRAPLQHIMADIKDLREAIGDTFMVPLFMFLLRQQAGVQPDTATTTNAKLREQAVMLGPVQEHQADELMDPFHNRALDIMFRRSEPFWRIGEDGLLPRPPKVLQNEEWVVRYTSEASRSQKLPDIAVLERYLNMLGTTMDLDPTVVDGADLDEIMQVYAEAAGVPPMISRTDEQIAAIRQARAAEREAAARAQAAPGLAAAAKDLGQTPRQGGTTLLEDVLASSGAPPAGS